MVYITNLVKGAAFLFSLVCLPRTFISVDFPNSFVERKEKQPKMFHIMNLVKGAAFLFSLVCLPRTFIS